MRSEQMDRVDLLTPQLDEPDGWTPSEMDQACDS